MSVGNAGLVENDWGCFGASGFFETIRVENGQPHLLGAHLARLFRSADAWGFPRHCTPEALAERVRTACAGLGDDAITGIRIIYEAGRIALTPREVGAEYGGPLACRPRWAGVIVHELRALSTSPLAGFKSTDRMIYERIRRIAQSRTPRPHFDAIVLNERGEIVEGGVSNLYWLRGGDLFTPAPYCGGLPGVFALYVKGLAAEAGIAVHEVAVSPDALLAADAAFLTNSLGEIMGLDSIDAVTLAPPFENAVVKVLTEATESARAARALQ